MLVAERRRSRAKRNPRRLLLGMAHEQRRDALAAALRDEGHSVVTASDGYELVSLMSAPTSSETGLVSRPDLIIADVTMPGCSGMAILDKIRELHCDTPVFLIVDFNRPEIAERAFARGANRIFEKPIDIDDVRASTQTFLLNRPRHAVY